MKSIILLLLITSLTWSLEKGAVATFIKVEGEEDLDKKVFDTTFVRCTVDVVDERVIYRGADFMDSIVLFENRVDSMGKLIDTLVDVFIPPLKYEITFEEMSIDSSSPYNEIFVKSSLYKRWYDSERSFFERLDVKAGSLYGIHYMTYWDFYDRESVYILVGKEVYQRHLYLAHLKAVDGRELFSLSDSMSSRLEWELPELKEEYSMGDTVISGFTLSFSDGINYSVDGIDKLYYNRRFVQYSDAQDFNNCFFTSDTAVLADDLISRFGTDVIYLRAGAASDDPANSDTLFSEIMSFKLDTTNIACIIYPVEDGLVHEFMDFKWDVPEGASVRITVRNLSADSILLDTIPDSKGYFHNISWSFNPDDNSTTFIPSYEKGDKYQMILSYDWNGKSYMLSTEYSVKCTSEKQYTGYENLKYVDKGSSVGPFVERLEQKEFRWSGRNVWYRYWKKDMGGDFTQSDFDQYGYIVSWTPDLIYYRLNTRTEKDSVRCYSGDSLYLYYLQDMMRKCFWGSVDLEKEADKNYKSYGLTTLLHQLSYERAGAALSIKETPKSLADIPSFYYSNGVVSVSDIARETNYKIYSLNGREIMAGTISPKKGSAFIPVRSLAKGVYMMQLKTSSQRLSKRLLIR